MDVLVFSQKVKPFQLRNVQLKRPKEQDDLRNIGGKDMHYLKTLRSAFVLSHVTDGLFYRYFRIMNTAKVGADINYMCRRFRLLLSAHNYSYTYDSLKSVLRTAYDLEKYTVWNLELFQILRVF